MTLNQHPTPETLAAYAAGTLDLGRHIVVASHVERCAKCGGFVRSLQTAGGIMMEDLSPVAMSPDSLAHMMARIEREPRLARPNAPIIDPAGRDPAMPSVLKSYRLGDWRWVGPGVHMRPVHLPSTDGARVFFLKARPGTRMPEHTHGGSELTSILVGSYRHEGGHFPAGSFEEADGDIEHRPVVDDDMACICLVALEGQLKLSGVIGSLLNPFIRL